MTPVSTPEIRRATLRDVEALIDLRLALFREMRGQEQQEDRELIAFSYATRAYLWQNLPNGAFLAWVAEVDGAIVATSGLVFYTLPPTPVNLSGRDAYVMNMYTAPEWRGQGLATALLHEIIAFVRGTETRRIRLRASVAGKPIYERLGFESKDSEMELELA